MACSGPQPGAGDHDGEAALALGRRAVELVVEGPEACARSEGGRVACWGADVRLEPAPECSQSLGRRCPFVPRIAGAREPRWVSGLEDARSVALGGFGAAIRQDGTVVAWSLTGPGALEARPVRGPVAVTQLALGLLSGCAGGGSGRVWCWGDPSTMGTIDAPGWSEASEAEAVEQAIHIDADLDRTCAVEGSGEVTCWGRGDPAGLEGIDEALEVRVDGALTCLRSRGGAVACRAEVGAAPELAGVAEAVAIDLDGGRLCAVERSGRACCAGGGLDGLELDGVIQLDLGGRGGCAVRSDGQVVCFGPGAAGAATVAGLDDALAVAVDDLVCALRRGGRLACWGTGYGPEPVTVTLPPE